MQTTDALSIRRLRHDAILPVRSTPHAAGLDLFACEAAQIPAGRHGVVSTGIAIALPEDCVGLVWPRSGLSLKHGIGTLAGVIDSDYRGEIKVVLMNNGDRDYEIQKGDRIAQLLIQKIQLIDPVEVDVLPDSSRGESGFGSSGR